MPEAINTPEDAYTILSIALSQLSESERKGTQAIGDKLAKELGLGKKKRQELDLGRSLGDFMEKAIEAGWVTQLDDGQYIPIPRSEEIEDENDADDDSEPDSQPSEIERDDVELTLDDYDFKTKIEAFVEYITQ